MVTETVQFVVTEESSETNSYVKLPKLKSFTDTPLSCVIVLTVTALQQALKSLTIVVKSVPENALYGNTTSIVFVL